MKYYETSYSDYVKRNKEFNLHKYYDNYFIMNDLDNIENCIIYGEKGIGKYTQALRMINNFSDSELCYSKKVPITVQNKNDYIIRISDIHFEVDMELLGCNARTLWHDIYNQIIDIVMASQNKKGIILCRNFEYINNELLDIFYCYLNNVYKILNVKFILLTKNISFIPYNILNNINVLSYEKISQKDCLKLVKKNSKAYNFQNKKKIQDKQINLNNVSNIKALYENIQLPYKNFCDDIYFIIIKKVGNVDYFELRETLYNILLHHIDVYECFYYILKKLFKGSYIKIKQLNKINIKIIELSKLYNNNYRPIFHLERFALYLNSVVNDNELQNSD